MTEADETSAGGVVYRPMDSYESGPVAHEVAIALQHDRITRTLTVRLPKGHLERGETAEQAAVREVREEFGLHARVISPLGTSRYVYESGSGPVRKEVHVFLLEWIPGEALPLDGEMERVDWCSLDEAERRLTFETERCAIGWARAELLQRTESIGGQAAGAVDGGKSN